MKVELYPTIVTPFTPENQIDYASLGRLIDHLLTQASQRWALCSLPVQRDVFPVR